MMTSSVSLVMQRAECSGDPTLRSFEIPDHHETAPGIAMIHEIETIVVNALDAITVLGELIVKKVSESVKKHSICGII